MDLGSPVAARPSSTALFTDHYELTMLDAALASGAAHRRAVFEVFARHLPPGRRYGVVAGTGRFLDAVGDFRFGPAELDHLGATGLVSPAALAWLGDYRFSGSVDGYREGELYFPGSPVLTVEATFAEAVVLETLALSVLNFDSAVASAAARVSVAAGGRRLAEMGSRRTHEEAAVAAARAAYLVGFDSTSNLEAGRRYGVPTLGTTAHAFVLAHPSERAAFDAQIATQGVGTTLLVDTYDTAAGVRTAVEAARAAGAAGPGAVRIDSGDLAAEVHRARALLDSLGAPATRIVVTGDLDEHAVAALAPAPADAYGLGTAVVTGSGHPTAGFVYKLVAIGESADPGAPLRPVAKTSVGKATVGGRMVAARLLDDDGFAAAEAVTASPAGPRRARALQAPLVRAGEVVADHDLAAARATHLAARAELRPEHLDLADGPPAFGTTRPTTEAP